MSDIIGKATIALEAQSDQFNADMVKSGQVTKQFGDSVAKSSEKSVAALNTIGAAAGDSAQTMSRAQQSAIQSLQRQVAAMQGGKIAAAELKAAQLGIAESAAPLIAKWRELENAQRGSSAATDGALASMAQLAETEAEASARIREMVAASLQKTSALQAEAAASRAAAAAAREHSAAGNSSGAVPTAKNSGMSGMQRTADEVTEVNRALASISQGAGSMKAVQDQTDKLLLLWSQGRITAEQYASAVKQIDASELGLVKSSAQASAATEQFLARLKDQAATAGLSAKQLLEYRAAQLGVTGAAAPFIEKIEAGAKSLHGFSLESSGAKRELAVLAREVGRGDFGAAGRSLSIFAERAGLMQTLTSPLALGIGAVATAAGLLAFAAYKGAEEQDKFNSALVITGGYAGTTADGLHTLAVQAAASSGSLSVAKEAVEGLAASGKFTADQIATIATAATQMQIATGQAVDVTIAQFERLGKEPSKSILELNNQYHFLTLAVYEQIVALEKQGNAVAAAKLAEDTFATTLGQRTTQIVQNQGIMIKGWNAVKSAVNSAVDAMLNIGKTTSLSSQLADLDNQLNSRAGRGAVLTVTGSDRDKLISRRATLQTQLDSVNATAAAKSKAQQDEDGKIQADAWMNSFRKEFASQAQKRDEEIKEYNARASKLGLSSAQQAADIANINSKYKDKQAPHANENGINTELKALQAQYQERERALKLSNANIKAQYDLGLLDTQGYLDKEHAAKAAALDDEMKLADEQAEIAKQKKSGVALEEAKGQQKKIRDEQLENDRKYFADSAALEKKNADAVQAFTQSLSDSYKTRQQAINDLIAGTGLGDAERAQLARLNQVQQEYDKAVEVLNKSRAKGEANGGPSQEVYDQELQALKDNLAARLDLERQGSDDLIKSQADGWNGATRFMQDYAASAANTAAQVEQVFRSASSGMEDAFATFVTTGKLNFSTLATSVIADIAKMQARAAISGLFSFAISAAAAYFGGSSAGGDGAAAGNPGDGALGFGDTIKSAKGNVFQSTGLSHYSNSIVTAPTMFAFAKGAGLMGEAGPEAILPLTRTAGGALGVQSVGGSGGGDIQVNVYVQQDGTSNVEAPPGLAQFGRELGDFVDARIGRAAVKSAKQGGQIWNMQNA